KTIYRFSYNGMNQLVEERSEKRQDNYVYDVLGSLKEHNLDTFVSNALNQVSGSKTPCHYDQQGNFVSSGNFSYSYNDSNQMVEAKESSSGKFERYYWDALGRRIAQESNGIVRRYLYIGNSEVGAVDQYGGVVELKIPEKVINNVAYGAVTIVL